jgi:hypothetical protein
MLSFRLLQMLLKDDPKVIRDYMAELRKGHESLPNISLDTEPLEDRLKSYVETPVTMPAVRPVIQGGEISLAAAAIPRGDVFLAGDRGSEAGKWYNADTEAARAARAIVSRFSRSPLEANRVLARAWPAAVSLWGVGD